MTRFIYKLIVGGQTGCERGALAAARKYGIPTGGHAAYAWETEIGSDRSLADWGLFPAATPGYEARTLLNAADSDALILFGHPELPENYIALAAAQRYRRDTFHVARGDRPADVAGWLMALAADADSDFTLWVNGSRATREPGIESITELFLDGVFGMTVKWRGSDAVDAGCEVRAVP